jgi:hypothetical protein
MASRAASIAMMGVFMVSPDLKFCRLQRICRRNQQRRRQQSPKDPKEASFALHRRLPARLTELYWIVMRHGFISRCQRCSGCHGRGCAESDERSTSVRAVTRRGHGTSGGWHSGCRCTPCRAAHAETQRTFGRARAQQRLPAEVRQQLLDGINAGQSFRSLLRDLGLTPNQVWGLTKTDERGVSGLLITREQQPSQPKDGPWLGGVGLNCFCPLGVEKLECHHR